METGPFFCIFILLDFLLDTRSETGEMPKGFLETAKSKEMCENSNISADLPKLELNLRNFGGLPHCPKSRYNPKI